jgi:alanyl-tRNA synthetase
MYISSTYLLQCDLKKKKNQIKQLLNKEKEYFIEKIEITPKRLEIGIHNVNKSGLQIKFYIDI